MPDSEPLKRYDDEIEELKRRLTSLEGNMGRISSHIESEIGLTRSDLRRIEKRLFGEDDDEHGGRIGYINKRIYRMEIWFLAIVCSSGILLFLAGLSGIFKATLLK